MTKPLIKTTEALPIEARVAQCISDFEAPHTTQDAIDQLASEYYVANLLRQHADKRHEEIKKTIVDNSASIIAQLRNDATEHKRKETQDIVGEDWAITLNVNKPATKCSADDLKTALVKRGISAKLIDEAITEATKNLMPALSVVARHIVE